MSRNSTPIWSDPEIIEQRAARHYEDLPFHGFSHALDVRDEAREICTWYKNIGHPVTPAEEQDVEVAALYHDAGYHVPISDHSFRSKERYSASIVKQDQAELGMPNYRIKRCAGAIIGTQLGVRPVTNVAKILRQADLSNVAKKPPLQVIRNSILLFKEDEILKRDYNHPGEIKTDLLSFISGSLNVMRTYGADDVSLGEFDRDEHGMSIFEKRLNRGMECFLPSAARSLLSQLGLGQNERTIDQEAS